MPGHKRGVHRHPSGDIILPLQHQFNRELDYNENGGVDADNSVTEASDKSPDNATQELEQTFTTLMNSKHNKKNSKQKKQQPTSNAGHGAFDDQFSNDFDAMPDAMDGFGISVSDHHHSQPFGEFNPGSSNDDAAFDPFSNNTTSSSTSKQQRNPLDNPFSDASRKAAGRAGAAGGGGFEERTVMSWQSSDLKRNMIKEHAQLRSAQRMEKLRAEMKDKNDITAFPEPEFADPVVHQQKQFGMKPQRRNSLDGGSSVSSSSVGLSMESYSRQMSSRSVATANTAPVSSLSPKKSPKRGLSTSSTPNNGRPKSPMKLNAKSPLKAYPKSPKTPVASVSDEDMGYENAVPDSEKQQHNTEEMYRQTMSSLSLSAHNSNHSRQSPARHNNNNKQVWGDDDIPGGSLVKASRRSSIGSSNHSSDWSAGGGGSRVTAQRRFSMGSTDSAHSFASSTSPRNKTAESSGNDSSMKKSMSSVELYRQVKQQQQQHQDGSNQQTERRASVGHAPKTPDSPSRSPSAGGVSARGRRAPLPGDTDNSSRRRSNSVGVDSSRRERTLDGGVLPKEHSIRGRRNSTGGTSSGELLESNKGPSLAASLQNQSPLVSTDGFSVISGLSSSRSIFTAAAAPMTVSDDTVRRLVRERMSGYRSRSKKRLDEPSEHDDSYSTSSEESEGDSDIYETEVDETEVDETEGNEDHSSALDLHATEDALAITRGASSENGKVIEEDEERKKERKHKRKTKEGKKISSKSKDAGDKEKKKPKKSKKADGEKKKTKKSSKNKDNSDTKESKLKKKASSASADSNDRPVLKKRNSRRKVTEGGASPPSPGKSPKKKVSKIKLDDEATSSSGMKKSKSSAALDQEGKKHKHTKTSRRGSAL